ncbi:MAG: dialkylresorcinol condensing enzyme DarA [Capnocytophaga sp.]|nr:dialkylresorcinol condensing enzyme DarA [Capnocytophaga sp.]
MKKVLVVYYSQTGQLKDIADHLVRPMQESNEVEVDFCKIEMENDFPFPWTAESFFGAFPESFLLIPQPIKPLSQQIINKNYDLIILAYQVWFLSPSIPFNSFLQSKQGKQLITGKPVITVSGTRNMWVLAQQKVKKLIENANGKLVGNIALTDRNFNHISVITIVHWLFTGKKERYLGIFPLPGVSQSDIERSVDFGSIILSHVKSGNYEQMQTKIIQKGGVHIKHFLISADKKANRLFGIWANKIYGSPKRKFLLKCFHLYLYVAIWVLMPIVFLFYLITYPFFWRKIQKEIKQAQSI